MKLNYFYINIFCFLFFSKVTFCWGSNHLEKIFSFLSSKKAIVGTLPLIVAGQIFHNNIKNNKINDIESNLDKLKGKKISF
jgi:hypothetical protein